MNRGCRYAHGGWLLRRCRTCRRRTIWALKRSSQRPVVSRPILNGLPKAGAIRRRIFSSAERRTTPERCCEKPARPWREACRRARPVPCRGDRRAGAEIDGGIASRIDGVPFGIVLNRDAARFYDEGEDFWPKRYAIWGRLVAGQPDQIAYACWTRLVSPDSCPRSSRRYATTASRGLPRPAWS